MENGNSAGCSWAMICVKWDTWSVLSAVKQELEIKTHCVSPGELQRVCEHLVTGKHEIPRQADHECVRSMAWRHQTRQILCPQTKHDRIFKRQELCCCLWRSNPLTLRSSSADCTDSCEMDLEDACSFGKHALPMVWNFAELFFEIPASLWKITFSSFICDS